MLLCLCWLSAHQWLYTKLEGHSLLRFCCWTLYPACLCAVAASFCDNVCPASTGLSGMLFGGAGLSAAASYELTLVLLKKTKKAEAFTLLLRICEHLQLTHMWCNSKFKLVNFVCCNLFPWNTNRTTYKCKWVLLLNVRTATFIRQKWWFMLQSLTETTYPHSEVLDWFGWIASIIKNMHNYKNCCVTGNFILVLAFFFFCCPLLWGN